jgi:hypothetical protein
LNSILAPDAARRVAVGAEVICAPVSLLDPDAACPFVNRESTMVVVNRLEMTDRGFFISIYFFPPTATRIIGDCSDLSCSLLK